MVICVFWKDSRYFLLTLFPLQNSNTLHATIYFLVKEISIDLRMKTKQRNHNRNSFAWFLSAAQLKFILIKIAIRFPYGKDEPSKIYLPSIVWLCSSVDGKPNPVEPWIF